MIQRVMPDLMNMKNIMALNDEAHHCYREKQGGTGRAGYPRRKEEAKKNNRGWPGCGFLGWKGRRSKAWGLSSR